MEAMRSAIDPTVETLGRAPMQLLDDPSKLYYPTPYGQLLEIDRFAEALIEPTFAPDELPPNEVLSPLLIDSDSSTICVRAIDMVLEKVNERVIFNCFMAYHGQSWFNGRDVALALIHHDIETKRFTKLARDLQDRFLDEAGTSLYIHNGRATKASRVQTNTDLVPISMKLIREGIPEAPQPRERLTLVTPTTPEIAEKDASGSDEEPATDEAIFDAFMGGEFDDKIKKATEVANAMPIVQPKKPLPNIPLFSGVVSSPKRRNPDSENWQDLGNCLGVDPELFFPERGASTRPAKETCKGCVVREDCLEYALSNGERFGIWGGMSERERRRIRRQRAIARAAVSTEQSS